MRRERLIPLLLLVITAAIFWPVGRFKFINYDDPVYVAGNPGGQGVNPVYAAVPPGEEQGLNGTNLDWAFTAVVVSNWQPVTCLSHLLDVQLFGYNAGAHHLVNVLFHAVNVLLLFLLLRRLTGARWPSAVVAALFAWHPLHVESVAWVSERKDVLSTCFGLLTLLAYAGYARAKSQPAGFRTLFLYYLAAICLYALGLLSKPMLVTWPGVLLLLDFWPLRRIPDLKPATLGPLILEKLPFFALSAAASLITYYVQHLSGAMEGMAHLTLGQRVGNALVAYARYLGKTVWPDRLAFFYPHPASWPPGQIAAATALLAILTFIAVRETRRRPYLLFGWLWFLGTLVPVIGLVQVGDQSMADRYTYLPLVGLFIALAWGVSEWTERRPALKRWGAGATFGALTACLLATRAQLDHWRDTETLTRHALQVASPNFLAHSVLGLDLIARGKTAEGIEELRAELALRPEEYQDRCLLADLLARQGNTREAIAQYRQVLRRQPDLPDTLNNLAWPLATAPDAAIRNGAEAVRCAEHACSLTRFQKPIFLGTLAAAYAEAGRYDDAVRAGEQAAALAETAGDTALAEKNRQLLELYRARRPFHEPAP
jgi:protein O-mannosyl-transferase